MAVSGCCGAVPGAVEVTEGRAGAMSHHGHLPRGRLWNPESTGCCSCSEKVRGTTQGPDLPQPEHTVDFAIFNI